MKPPAPVTTTRSFFDIWLGPFERREGFYQTFQRLTRSGREPRRRPAADQMAAAQGCSFVSITIRNADARPLTGHCPSLTEHHRLHAARRRPWPRFRAKCDAGTAKYLFIDRCGTPLMEAS